jgi:hypothetical protein
MVSISGTYRMVSSENLAEDCQAAFGPYMSAEDIKLMLAPDNQWTMTIKEKEDGVIIKAEYRKEEEQIFLTFQPISIQQIKKTQHKQSHHICNRLCLVCHIFFNNK